MGNISSRFSGNSKTEVSELPENLEEMFPRYLLVILFILVLNYFHES